MLRKIILVGIGFAITMSAIAQVTVNRTGYGSVQEDETLFTEDINSTFVMKYGVKAALNMTSMSNDMSFEPGFGTGVGFSVGGFLNMRWEQRSENSLPGTGFWGFQPEIMYSNEVVKSDAGNIKMNYIAVPLLLKLYPTAALSIEIGPEFLYLISTSPSTIAVDGAEINVGDCKGMNFGLAAGVAYDFRMGLTMGARYTYGFTDMAENLKWKSNNIQFSLGWMF